LNTEQITRYFPHLNEQQINRLSNLKPLYEYWNSRINVISRKDMDNFYLHHVLHSLSIAKIINFTPGTRILDVGTGGGFPGIPLAIMFPESEFYLLDSIAKKINVVAEVAKNAGINNVSPLRKRMEEETGIYDFIISRAVTGFDAFVKLTSGNISTENLNLMHNGIFYLKGGDLEEELKKYASRIKIFNIKDLFSEPFFETKKIVYLPLTK